MTLSSAFNIINTSFAAIGTQSATIATNVANANTAGYSRQITNLGTDPYGGVSVFSVTRVADAALAAQLNAATSDSAAQSAISTGLATLAQTVSDSATSTTTSGTNQNGQSPSAMIGNFASAMASYEATPNSVVTAQAAVTAASSLASSLNAGSAAVTSVRSNADQQIGKAVNQVNTLLSQFQTANTSIVAALANGSNVSSLQDQRDSIVSQIAQEIGVNTSLSPSGSMSIFADNGATLFQNIPSTLSFTPSGTLGAGITGNAVYLNGQPITGSSANVPIQSGAIAGLVQLRDTVAPEYQAQLDQIAGNLITGFQETDQSTTNTGLAALPGLFTTPGATSVPASSDWTGLASDISVNASVDPTQGGDATLLRDGGISDTTDTNYTYNTSGSAGYTDRLQQLVTALQTPMSFASSAGLGTSSSITNYAQDSVSWLQGANQQATNDATYQASLATQASSALNNATGVNLDTELTNMLSIESSYTASAKLLTSANSMLTTLLSAVNP
jgi:flagellar hook-associated protein 1 FlgK